MRRYENRRMNADLFDLNWYISYDDAFRYRVYLNEYLTKHKHGEIRNQS